MKLSDYIRGSRRGKAANRFERQAMGDPFLAEALEGYDRVPGDHTEKIVEMRKRVTITNRKRHMQIRSWSAAASIILLLGVSVYFLMNETDQRELAEDLQIEQAVAEMEEEAPMVQQEQRRMAVAEKKSADSSVTPVPSAIVADRSAKESTSSAKPVPLIGEKEYNEYIHRSLTRPADEHCRDRKGLVVLHFLINSEGRPYDIKVIRSLCDSADQEAIRLIQEGPSWTIGTQTVEWTIEF